MTSKLFIIFISFSIWRWFSGSNTHPYLLL